MKVKELFEFLKDNLESKKITPETEIIVLGEYNYGESIGKPHVEYMNLIDEKEIIKEHEKVVAINIGAYLFEHEDVGYSRMWIDEQDLEEFKEYEMEDEEEFEF